MKWKNYNYGERNFRAHCVFGKFYLMSCTNLTMKNINHAIQMCNNNEKIVKHRCESIITNHTHAISHIWIIVLYVYMAKINFLYVYINCVYFNKLQGVCWVFVPNGCVFFFFFWLMNVKWMVLIFWYFIYIYLKHILTKNTRLKIIIITTPMYRKHIITYIYVFV